MANPPNSQSLETFTNPRPGREYEIKIEAPEFTCVCPKTGQPDFATMTLIYVPLEKCVELKAYKVYIHAWRNVGIFHEAVTNQIADDLIKALDPVALSLEGAFHAHGGITTSVLVEYDREMDGAFTGQNIGPQRTKKKKERSQSAAKSTHL